MIPVHVVLQASSGSAADRAALDELIRSLPASDPRVAHVYVAEPPVPGGSEALRAVFYVHVDSAAQVPGVMGQLLEWLATTSGVGMSVLACGPARL